MNEPLPVTKRRMKAASSGDAFSPTTCSGMPAPPVRDRHLADALDVAVVVVEVADEQDGRAHEPIAPDHVQGEGEPGRDPRAGRERLGPWAARRARERAGAALLGELEEALQRPELPRGRLRWQRLVGGVGEEDEPVGAVRARRAARASRRSARRCRRRCSPTRPGRRCRSTMPAGATADCAWSRNDIAKRPTAASAATAATARRSRRTLAARRPKQPRVAERDRGHARASAACSRRSASERRVGRPGLGSRPSDRGGVERQVGPVDDAGGKARGPPAVGRSLRGPDSRRSRTARATGSAAAAARARVSAVGGRRHGDPERGGTEKDDADSAQRRLERGRRYPVADRR